MSGAVCRPMVLPFVHTTTAAYLYEAVGMREHGLVMPPFTQWFVYTASSTEPPNLLHGYYDRVLRLGTGWQELVDAEVDSLFAGRVDPELEAVFHAANRLGLPTGGSNPFLPYVHDSTPVIPPATALFDNLDVLAASALLYNDSVHPAYVLVDVDAFVALGGLHRVLKRLAVFDSPAFDVAVVARGGVIRVRPTNGVAAAVDRAILARSINPRKQDSKGGGK